MNPPLIKQSLRSKRLRNRCRKKDRAVLEHTYLISTCDSRGYARCAYCNAEFWV